MQCRPKDDVGPTLHKCYTNALCLPGRIKTVPTMKGLQREKENTYTKPVLRYLDRDTLRLM